MMEVKTVGLASDHAGYALKQFVKEYLAEKGYAYKDFGTDSEASCDYADYAHPLAQAVEDGECYPGIAICGSGEGISMTLNKHQGIRAGLSRKSPICAVSTTMPMCWSCRDVSSTRTWRVRSWTNSSPRILRAVAIKDG